MSRAALMLRTSIDVRSMRVPLKGLVLSLSKGEAEHAVRIEEVNASCP